MRRFLLFRLYGPMAAWGEVAVGEARPSAAHPSKSAVLGMVAAALGIRRNEEERLKQLGGSLGFAVRVDAAGELLRDYHTAQVPPEKRKVKYYTRRDELKGDDVYTILSSRDYRTDGCYSIALWSFAAETTDPLAEIEHALKQPRLPLYMGRKSCPLGLPLNPVVVEAVTMKAAFDGYAADRDGFLRLRPPNGNDEQRRYYWEQLDDAEAGMAAAMRYPRRDLTLSRKRWQFMERDEFLAVETKREAAP